jgi:hypothetical protein
MIKHKFIIDIWMNEWMNDDDENDDDENDYDDDECMM